MNTMVIYFIKQCVALEWIKLQCIISYETKSGLTMVTIVTSNSINVQCTGVATLLVFFHYTCKPYCNTKK